MSKSGRKPTGKGGNIRKSSGSKPPSRKKPSSRSRRPASRPPSSSQDGKPRASGRSNVKRVSKRRPVSRRPRARADKRKAAVASRPMPSPPRRRAVAPLVTTHTTEPREELVAEVDRLHDRFGALETEAQLGVIYAAIGELDHRLVALPTALDALRDRGYVHSGRLDDELEALDDRWDATRSRIESALQSHVRSLDRELDETERQLTRLQPRRSSIRSAESAIDGLQRQVASAIDAVESLYRGMDSDLRQIDRQMAVVTKMMDQISESKEFQLLTAEGPLLAIESQWQRDGKDGPEGILILTDQRLVFENRQEIVTKKTLGIFKSESEKLQELMLEVQVSDIEAVSAKEEGGFLGMGKDDILEFVFAATASVSRAKFHIKGQDSSDWAKMIKRVQTGEIDEDRADEYVEELEEAEAVAASFPEVCPNCFADVPSQPRGVSSVICEYCGTLITAESPNES